MTVGAARDIIDLLAERRSALLQLARDHGAGSFAVFGFGSALGAGSASHGALRFFSGWDGHESLSLLLATQQGAHLLVGSPFMLPLARELQPDLAVEHVPPLDWGKALVALANGTCVATVGFGELPRQLDAALTADGFVAGPSLDDAAARLRLVKDAAALGRHRDAAALCDLLFGRLGAELARRRPAWEIQLDLETEARRQGADYCRTWLTVAPAADYPRYWPAEARRVPEPGDQVLFGVALTVDGHWGHGIRMGSIGPQKAEHRELAGHVEAMLEAGLSVLRPGLPLGGAEQAMEAVLAESFERIHRANLVNVGVLPVEFLDGEARRSLKIDGTEVFDLQCPEPDLTPGAILRLSIRRADETRDEISVRCRLDTVEEVKCYRRGGLIPQVLQELTASAVVNIEERK